MTGAPPAIVKWIRAAVEDTAAFDEAQRGWQRVVGWPGLLGQTGGWSRERPDRAVIVALWTDPAAHDAFLAGTHDDIADPQRATYTSIAVDLLKVEMHTEPGSFVGPSGQPVLRIAACRLREGRLEHALEVQRQLWLPAMRDAGMSRGLLARGVLRPDEHTLTLVVMTWWPSYSIHERYQRERVAQLRDAADVATDFISVEGDLINLEPSWTLTGP